jgi:hypothetical protein
MSRTYDQGLFARSARACDRRSRADAPNTDMAAASPAGAKIPMPSIEAIDVTGEGGVKVMPTASTTVLRFARRYDRGSESSTAAGGLTLAMVECRASAAFPGGQIMRRRGSA